MNLRQLWSIFRGRRINFSWMNASWTYDPPRRDDMSKNEAQFLLDRLEEYDPEDEDHVRDFHGHVAPAIARLRNALANKPDEKE